MRNGFRDALRMWGARREHFTVATVGVTAALSACVIVAWVAIAMAAPDPSIPDPDRIVLLDFKGNPPGQPSPWFTGSPVVFGPMLKERSVPLDLISRVAQDGIDISTEGRLEPALLLIADPDIVPLLGFKSLAGDLRRTLLQRDGIAITTDLLRKLWGDLPATRAIGRRIDAKGTVFVVTTVLPDMDPRHPLGKIADIAGRAMAMVGFESPANPMSRKRAEAIYLVNGRVFARLHQGTSIDQIGGWMRDAFRANPQYAQLPAEWRTNREAAYFRGITLAQLPFEGEENALRWRLIGAVAGACVLLLLMAAFNTMNLQTANLLQRQRETALRRSLGADARGLLRLWGIEASFSLLLAGLTALLVAWWFAPFVASWMRLPPDRTTFEMVPSVIVGGLTVTLLALLVTTLTVPAWLALRSEPAPALQGRTASEGPWGRRIRQALLTAQLAGVVLLLSLAGTLVVQQRYLLLADRGYDTRDRLSVFFLTDPARVPAMTAFLHALDRSPAVKSWAFGPELGLTALGAYELHVGASKRKQLLSVARVSPRFFETWGITLVAGAPVLGTGEKHIVIDESAARLLGFASPRAALEQVVLGGGSFMQEGTDPRRIVGVIRDVRLESARDKVLPHGFLLSDRTDVSLNIHGTNLAVLRKQVEDAWKKFGPPLVHAVQTADEQRAFAYRQERQLTSMVAVIALLAVGVAMLGAYSLVADTLRRRRTELILRRLHGAGSGAIVREVTSEFILPLLAAAAVGLPLAGWLGARYLAEFVDHVSVEEGIVSPMIVAILATLAITLLAALRQLRQALVLQPIEALK